MPAVKGKFQPILPRLAARSRVEAGCWVWLGSHSTAGYGTIGYRGTTDYIHRIVYSLLVGPVPDGYEIDHLCRRRDCFNPRHLEAVIPRTNKERGMCPWAVAERNGTCQAGHPRTEENTYYTPDGSRRQCRDCNHLRYLRRLNGSSTL